MNKSKGVIDLKDKAKHTINDILRPIPLLILFTLIIPLLSAGQNCLSKGTVYLGGHIINFQPYGIANEKRIVNNITTRTTQTFDFNNTFLGINFWFEGGYFLSDKNMIGFGVGAALPGGVGTSFKLFYRRFLTSKEVKNTRKTLYYINTSCDVYAAFAQKFKGTTSGVSINAGPGLSIKLVRDLYLSNLINLSLGFASNKDIVNNKYSSTYFTVNYLMGIQYYIY